MPQRLNGFVDFLTISSGVKNSSFWYAPGFAIASISFCAVFSPSCWWGWVAVVSGTSHIFASFALSMPTIEMSSGTLMLCFLQNESRLTAILSL